MKLSGHLPALTALTPRYPLDRRLGGPQRRSGCSGEGKEFHHCSYRQLNLSHAAHILVTILTELSQLLQYLRRNENKWTEFNSESESLYNLQLVSLSCRDPSGIHDHILI